MLAFTKRDPSIVVKKSMDICKLLNKFYVSTKVLDGSSSSIVDRIDLSSGSNE